MFLAYHQFLPKAPKCINPPLLLIDILLNNILHHISSVTQKNHLILAVIHHNFVHIVYSRKTLLKSERDKKKCEKWNIFGIIATTR